MKLFLKIILKRKQHITLLGFALISILGLAIASQTEILSLGAIAKTGPDFFTLFGERKDGKLVAVNQVTKQSVINKWHDITHNNSDIITTEDASIYVAKNKNKLSSIASIATSLLNKYMDTSQVYLLVICLFCIALFKAVMLFSNRFISRLIAIKISKDIRQDYFRSLQSLPMSFFHLYDIGSLSNRIISDSESVALAVNSLLINYIQAPITLLLTLAVCLSISWKFSIVVFLGFPLLIAPVIVLSRKIKKLSRSIQNRQDNFSSTLLDFLTGIMTVKLFRTEEYAFKQYQEHNNRIAKLEERNAIFSLIPRPLLHTIASLFFACILIVGIYQFSIQPAELLVFCGLLYLVYEPVKKFADENANIMKGCSAAERLYEIIQYQSLEDTKGNLKTFSGNYDVIRYQNVSFGYSKNKLILKDISFSLKNGESLGIVGPTGSGKTTLTKLLPRLYSTDSGNIFIDQECITSFSKDSLRKNIACVLQKPFLFYDTIFNNLVCGEDISEDDVWIALEKACAKDFVENLPLGLHTLLEESGKNLSGGQLQRLTIARALLKQAPILILDEATSSLDSISENHIKRIMQSMKGKCTQIIIAHNLTTLDYVDRILYLEDGHKVAEGTKKELLDCCPEFKRMWEHHMVSRIDQKLLQSK